MYRVPFIMEPFYVQLLSSAYHDASSKARWVSVCKSMMFKPGADLKLPLPTRLLQQ